MKRIISGIIVAPLLLVSMLTLAFNIQSARAQGTIYINPNGSIRPSTANITTSDNVTYTFTGNNYLPIAVNRSNIIINGMGHTLQTSNGIGFSLSHVSNVTIKNTTITNSYEGIHVYSSGNDTLSGNNITANSWCGIYLYSSSGNVLSGNNVTANSYFGILLESSSANVLSGNNVTANSGYGICLESSSGDTLSGNNITANSYYGIELWCSGNNVLSGNNVAANSDDGIYLMYSSGNVLSGNDVTSNSYGIYGMDCFANMWTGIDNVLSGNDVTSNSYGIYGSAFNGNVLSGNNVTGNSNGVYLFWSSRNTFFHNNFVNNTQQVSSDGSPNTWDNGYASGGNYWSDYCGVDIYTGPYQNVAGSDGIGDTPYIIDANNIDHYPLMNPYSTGPLSVTISPESAILDVGQSKSFSSVVSGGLLAQSSQWWYANGTQVWTSSTYSYQWYLNSAPVSGANISTWTLMPSSAGSYTVYLKVTDAASQVATSNSVLITANSQLSVTISPASVTMDIGQSQNFTSTVSGGAYPYSYRWYLNDTAVSGATDSSWMFTASSAGSFTIYVNVTDGVGVRAKSNVASIVVNTVPSVSISPSSVTLDIGQSRPFTSSVSGGASPYSYQWYVNGAPVSGATNPSWTFTPVSVGSYAVYLNVADSSGTAILSKSAFVAVAPSQVPVGGYSIPIHGQTTVIPLTPYIILTAILATVFTATKRRTKRVK